MSDTEDYFELPIFVMSCPHMPAFVNPNWRGTMTSTCPLCGPVRIVVDDELARGIKP